MKLQGIRVLSWTPVAAVLLCCAGIAVAQEAPAPANPAPRKEAQQGTPATSPALRLTLQDALARGRKNSTQFQSALTDAGLAREDKTQARDALLPGVNYNTQAFLRGCLDHALPELAGRNSEVFVVDNGSNDGSAAMVRRDFPSVTLLENGENLGFARANNRALRLAQTVADLTGVAAIGEEEMAQALQMRRREDG